MIFPSCGTHGQNQERNQLTKNKNQIQNSKIIDKKIIKTQKRVDETKTKKAGDVGVQLFVTLGVQFTLCTQMFYINQPPIKEKNKDDFSQASLRSFLPFQQRIISGSQFPTHQLAAHTGPPPQRYIPRVTADRENLNLGERRRQDTNQESVHKLSSRVQ